MLGFFEKLLDTEGFPARWNCGWGWTAELGWTHVISDLVIWGSYTAIPIVLAFFVVRRRDVPFPRIFWLFVAFIFFCGTGHLIEAVIFWEPVYRLAGLVKVGTAAASLATVFALIPTVPAALRMRTPEALEMEVQRRTERLRESEARQRVMMRELDHRVKNNITAIMSLADQTMASTGDFASFREAFMGRLLSLTRTHEALSASKWSGASVEDIAALTLSPYETGESQRISYSGPAAQLGSKAATSVSMALHELATNSVKYGALSTPGGTVDLAWTVEDDGLQLTWVERGGPIVERPEREGFGTTLIRGMIEHNLQGAVEIAYPPGGLECLLRLPGSALAGARVDFQVESDGSDSSHGEA